MTLTIFYSWQSDLPNRTNRGFIEEAIHEAIKKLGEDATVVEALRDNDIKIDKDTLNISGSPPIVDSIFNKIATCTVFVPDMTFVGKSDAGRLIPNPNVSVEYGWALRAVSNLRVVPVMNAHYGSPSWETLPFDMRHLRHPFAYDLSPNCSTAERQAAKTALATHLAGAFKTVLDSGVLEQRSTTSIDLIKEYVVDDKSRVKLHDLINKEVATALGNIDDGGLFAMPSGTTGEQSGVEFRRRARIFELGTAELRHGLATACFWGDPSHADNWGDIVQRFNNMRRGGSGLTAFLDLQGYPAFLIFQTCAFSSFGGNRVSTFARLMDRGGYRGRDGLLTIAADAFFPYSLFSGSSFDGLRDPPEKGYRWRTPGSLQLHDMLRESTVELLPDQINFDDMFDRFEYVHRLIFTDYRLHAGKPAYPAPGIFSWRRRDGHDGENVFSYFDDQVARYGTELPLLKAGLFGGTLERFNEARAAIDPDLKQSWWNYA